MRIKNRRVLCERSTCKGFLLYDGDGWLGFDQDLYITCPRRTAPYFPTRSCRSIEDSECDSGMVRFEGENGRKKKPHVVMQGSLSLYLLRLCASRIHLVRSAVFPTWSAHRGWVLCRGGWSCRRRGRGIFAETSFYCLKIYEFFFLHVFIIHVAEFVSGWAGGVKYVRGRGSTRARVCDEWHSHGLAGALRTSWGGYH